MASRACVSGQPLARPGRCNGSVPPRRLSRSRPLSSTHPPEPGGRRAGHHAVTTSSSRQGGPANSGQAAPGGGRRESPAGRPGRRATRRPCPAHRPGRRPGRQPVRQQGAPGQAAGCRHWDVCVRVVSAGEENEDVGGPTIQSDWSQPPAPPLRAASAPLRAAAAAAGPRARPHLERPTCRPITPAPPHAPPYPPH